ncbi:MAG: reverse transcriptase family protein [Oscillospiraceae bacterium]|nr:reverse transcriptase family protein [Oscillospiraceae bacterium]
MQEDVWKYFTREHHKAFLLSLELLGNTDWPEQKQLRCLYAVSRRIDSYYTRFSIPKPDGTARELLAPNPFLKRIQRNILRNILEKLPVSPYATAYRRGAGILKNASPHTGQKRILKLDIRRFFDSIPFYMVYSYAFPRIYYPPSVAVLLTHLCCYQEYLPQGAPTSAAISNLVMKPFDEYIGRWCGERGIIYTRYCDDITFSGDFDPAPVIRKARGFLSSMGFELNQKKTKVMDCASRQSVTGIVVNEKPQIFREYRNALRQELYYCEKYGVDSHLQRIYGDRLPIEPERKQRYLRSLSGRINYLLQINPEDAYYLRARDRIREIGEQKAAE